MMELVRFLGKSDLDVQSIEIKEKERRSLLAQLEIKRKIRAEKEERRRRQYFK